MNFKKPVSVAIGLMLLVALSAGCKQEKMILGAGSTFDNLLFSKLFYEYYLGKAIKVNYQSIGSGGGIKSLTDEIVDFAASDAPITKDQEGSMRGEVLHIPVTAGAIVMSYNLPGLKDTLRFTPAVLSGIFMGKITSWDDAAIATVNQGVALPKRAIVVVHRSDGSGTTNIFTTYLGMVSKEWAREVGVGSAVNWPVGLGGKGNEGVAGYIQQTTGAIGYIELAYAVKNGIPCGKVQNSSGNYIMPSATSVSAAANVPLPADGKALIANTPAADGYPISGFSWVLLYKEQKYKGRTKERGERIAALLDWVIHDGQQYSAALYYAPLPQQAVAVGDQLLQTLTFDGKKILNRK